MTPPTSAAISIPWHCSLPIIELASIAPAMNP